MENSEDKPQPIRSQGQLSVKLKWGSDEDLPTIYANNLFISHAGQEFYIVFGEAALTIVDKENPPDTLEIKPVVKLAISPQNMLTFLEVIKNNVERYKNRIESEEEGE
jgi:hypothetical protein